MNRQVVDTERRIRDLVQAERARLLAEAGLDTRPEHFRRPQERPFTADQRGHTTILISGLTLKHEKLVLGCLGGLGYRCEHLDVPDVRSFQIGKEYGNNGQCSPTYFTVGNLVKHLQNLRDRGMTRERILEDYVFLTSGGCGPCRFGMYEAEYRIALRNAGFDGFRVILFAHNGGLSQEQAELGLRMDVDFFLLLLTAISMGDLLNEVGHQIRPYEVEEGATDAALDRCVGILRASLADRSVADLGDAKFAVGLRRFLRYLTTDHYRIALARCRDVLAAVRVDRTRLVPKVKVTGEFWAQTTEGDGNYNMFRFLEGEGAEVIVEPIMNWLMYLLWQVKAVQRARFGSEGHRSRWRHVKKLARVSLAEKLMARSYEGLRKALGGTAAGLTDQMRMERLGHPYYNTLSQGGEGHLEVAKNIYYTSAKLAHMVLSLKPFGCMPSTQSDGAQAAVIENYPDMIYLPIETSGEGEINAHSRVQMALGEARRKAREEFERALEATGRSLEEIRAYVDGHEELRSAVLPLPRRGFAGTAARFVTHVAAIMGERR